jgi:methionine biosynthesis protein MetW
MTQRPPPRIDSRLLTDRSVDQLPQGLFEKRVEELARLLASRPALPSRTASATRWQDEIIAAEIPMGARVLDLGCGNGALLERLMRERGVRGQGVEIDPEAVFSCAERGVPVIQADLDEGLRQFPDQTFDVIVLEETLQTLSNPHEMLAEMLRVGRRGIVSFPNFAHWRVLVDLVTHGRMPVTEWLPYPWYETANIHPFTLQDLLDWSGEAGVRLVSGYAFENGSVRPLGPEDNLHAEEVLIVVER